MKYSNVTVPFVFNCRMGVVKGNGLNVLTHFNTAFILNSIEC